jgi:hypothetical protein
MLSCARPEGIISESDWKEREEVKETAVLRRKLYGCRTEGMEIQMGRRNVRIYGERKRNTKGEERKEDKNWNKWKRQEKKEENE